MAIVAIPILVNATVLYIAMLVNIFMLGIIMWIVSRSCHTGEDRTRCTG